MGLVAIRSDEVPASTLEPPPSRALPLPRPEAKLHARMLWTGSAIAVDLSILLLAIGAGALLRLGQGWLPSATALALLLCPVYLVIAAQSRCYAVRLLADKRRSARQALSAVLACVLAVTMLMFFAKISESISRVAFGLAGVVALILLPLGRSLLARAGSRVFGTDPFRVLVIRDGACVTPEGPAVVIDAADYGLSPDMQDHDVMDRLGQITRRADRTVVVCDPERREQWATALKGTDADAEIAVPELDRLGSLGLSKLGSATTLKVTQGSLGLFDRCTKRGLDLAVVLLSSPITLPLAGLVALAIRLESRGPILFAQQRIGQGNRLFAIYKFRSMRVDRCDAQGVVSASRQDHRITRVGRIIRMTSLDELPQLLNVLLGTMSLVGPRPHAAASTAENQLFWHIDKRYWERHAMKPGLTGLAQVRGFRGATALKQDVQQRVQADLEYLNGWSLWRDLAILATTLRVIRHKNAF